MKDFDIAIVGTGMVGLTFAAALASSDLKIVLVTEKLPQTHLPNDLQARISAITPTSQNIFSQLKVWSAIRSRPLGIFRKINVWDVMNKTHLSFDSAEIDKSELGFIVENQQIESCLYHHVRQFSNIHFVHPFVLNELMIKSKHVELVSDQNQKIQAKLVVGADGGKSHLRELAEIPINAEDYHQTAIISHIQTEKSHDEIATQYFLSTGPIGVLPLADSHRSSIVWSTTPTEAEKILKYSDEQFASELSAIISKQYGSVLNVTERFHFPLKMQHAKQYCLPHIALIGDAAHTIHPLAGQGVNMGIGDANALANVILQAHQEKKAFYDLRVLRKYERARKSENVLMLQMVKGLKTIFTQENERLAQLRGMGLNLLNHVNFLKNFFMKQAI